jgi:hypothetical protein
MTDRIGYEAGMFVSGRTKASHPPGVMCSDATGLYDFAKRQSRDDKEMLRCTDCLAQSIL